MTSSEPCHHCGWPNDYTAAKDARISSLEAELNARNARCLEQHVAQATRISSLEAELKEWKQGQENALVELVLMTTRAESAEKRVKELEDTKP